ncbi:carbohydrate binding family 9 domain-containing protein [Gracilimonas tropica]|uniref:carbohydrate binding family 9 domain-containing protein n=1 Tax=Gracilimonas tropica TaxID=454600 RepID=UPI00037C13EA|nr:carbohydrate binding family 9 domain-containing protein [Gracilimonas tropica]
MRSSLLIACLACFYIGFFQPATAQPAELTPRPTAFEATATFVEEAPYIDGNLDDVAWQNIPPITQFTQVWPNDGAPSTEDTEVRIAYDRDNLYFAFRFYDDDPELIKARNLERGGRNSRDDHAYIGLDTYMDGRNAYLFEANALGTQDDALITDENLDYSGFSWDAVFITETKIDDEGWTLEVAIPFRQLRFPDEEELEFGLMLSRTIIRKNERVLWPAIGQEYGGYNGVRSAVSQYGVLKGIKNIRRGNNIELKPYVISGVQETRPNLQTETTSTKTTYDIGGDMKWGITSNLTLDLTVNTDFAQVESDNVQVNLSRFSLFFPEKREFFLERAGLFEHGNSRSTQTFFSRRIGLTNQILTGARVTGQAGRFSYGAMNIETGTKMGDLFGSNSANNTVARLQAEVMPRATVGAIATNVEQIDGGYNRALGFDTNYRFWNASSFNAWFTNVWDDEQTLNDNAGHVSLRLDNDTYAAGFSFTHVGRNYNPALGFVRRRDMRQYSGNLGYDPQVQISFLPNLARLNFGSSYDFIEGQDGVKQSSQVSGSFGLEFTSSKSLRINANQQFERLFVPFNIREDAVIPAGDYTFERVSLNARSDDSQRIYGSAGIIFGSFYNGNRTDFGIDMGFRYNKHLSIDGGVNHSMIDLPIANGTFDATTVSTSIFGAISRQLYAKALIQYDNFSRDIQTYLRINWIHTPGSDLFLVFNTSHHITGDNEPLFDPRKDLILNNQAGIVKLTYLIML